ncbi:hypothetical protein IAR55_006310 [Kwoniella newhampshirensis]|uniref:DUF2264 domain-containing protein n=1 Tax=Kwoniella newhampshirensis TaxID=1651941 RepID=A0AAW0YV50_9TREE
MVQLLHSLLLPLSSAQSEGGARVHLGNTCTQFDGIAAEMEGYDRALWGLALLMASDPDNELEKWREGLDNGKDEKVEDENWGEPTDRDQRFVEMAAIVSVANFEIKTWLILPPTRSAPYHTRIHRFSIPSSSTTSFTSSPDAKTLPVQEGKAGRVEGEGYALAISRKGVVGVINLLHSQRRSSSQLLIQGLNQARRQANVDDTSPSEEISGILLVARIRGSVEDVDGNTNLISPRTVIPTIYHDLSLGSDQARRPDKKREQATGHQDAVKNETIYWIATRIFALPFAENGTGVKTRGWLGKWEEARKDGWEDVQSMKDDLRSLNKWCIELRYSCTRYTFGIWLDLFAKV